MITFVECLESYVEKRVYQNLIRSDKHNVYTITQQKITLSAHDAKRHLISGSYETILKEHYSIVKLMESHPIEESIEITSFEELMEID